MSGFSKIGSPSSEELIKLIDSRWKKASEDEANALVDIMVEFNNGYWGKYAAMAEKKQIENYDIVNDSYDEIMNSAATGIADWDQTVNRKPYTAEEQTVQRNLLESYLDKYRQLLSDADVENIDSAISMISA